MTRLNPAQRHTSRTNSSSLARSRPNRRRLIQAGGGLALAAASAPVLTRHGLGQEQIQIDFWNWWGVDREPLMNEIIAEFQEEYPNVVINSTVQPWDRRDEQVVTALSGGDPPEVMMATRAEIVQFASLGTIVPLDTYVEPAGVDVSRYYESEIDSMYWEDQLYSLPMPTAGGETNMVFYNNDLFTEAGLDPETPPATWEELDEAAAAMTVLSDSGGIDVMGVDIGIGSGAGFLSWLYCNDGALYSDDLQSVTFNSEQGMETLQWMVDFVNEHYGGIESVNDFFAQTTGESGEDPLYQNRLGWVARNVSQFFHMSNLAPDLDYGVALRPVNDANEAATSQGISGLTFGWGYVIPTGLEPDVEQAAFDWVKRLAYDEQGACRFVLDQFRPSPIEECNENPAYADENPHWDMVLESLASDIAVGVVPPQTRIMAILDQYVELAAFGEMGADEALDIAGQEAQALLDQYWASAE